MTAGAWWVLAIVVGVVLWYESQSDDGGSGDDGSGASVSDILAAIAKQENVDPSHNNPGAICGSFTNGVCNGPKNFATLDDGIAAAEALIQKILSQNPGITLRDFVTYWTSGPGAIGAPQSTAIQNYTSGMSNSLGLDPGDPIAGSGGPSDGDDSYSDDDSED